MKRKVKQCPVGDDKWLILSDNYGDAATGQKFCLDFSDICVDQLAMEAKECIRRKYEARAASTTYLRVLVPAVRHFAVFAKANGINSFLEYTDELGISYQNYLRTLRMPEGNFYSVKYQRYLWSVPAMIRRDMENVNSQREVSLNRTEVENRH